MAKAGIGVEALPEDGTGQVSALAGAAAGQILGRRSEQQDAYAFGVLLLADGRRAGVAVLADGMGGHEGGALAANVAVESFLHHCALGVGYSFSNVLGDALLAANRALAVEGRDRPELRGMGCTLVAAVLDGTVLHFISVGDSILWRIRDAKLERLNADHSMAPLVEAAVKSGEMSEQEAEQHRSGLRSALTGKPIAMIDSSSVELAVGDAILLASDGIFTLTDREILSLASKGIATANQDAVDLLLDVVEAEATSDQDNCTIMLVPIHSARSLGATKRRSVPVGAIAIILAGLGIAGFAAWQIGQSDLAKEFLATRLTHPQDSATESPSIDESLQTETPEKAKLHQGEDYSSDEKARAMGRTKTANPKRPPARSTPPKAKSKAKTEAASDLEAKQPISSRSSEAGQEQPSTSGSKANSSKSEKNDAEENTKG